ncbi:hypothetical protein AVEN_105910-1 [Araneus ventricosus]|uniref:Uncharacterized protein n=1 Tax=Araneus ventricosus TaxID=182803 RepID=A0A4Y2QDH5_ARAVE|nr:hypothetical protein AVEN_105910-1 [Araneus ventricosus]
MASGASLTQHHNTISRAHMGPIRSGIDVAVSPSQIAIVGSDDDNESDDAVGRIFYGRLASLEVECPDGRASFQELPSTLPPTMPKGMS